MEIRKTKLEDLDSVFELLDELYENKIEYSKFIQKYKVIYKIILRKNRKIRNKENYITRNC